MVDADVRLGPLQLCWYPDAEDGKVNNANVSRHGPLDLVDLAWVREEKCDAVDNDLEEHLDLDDPETKDEEEEFKAVAFTVRQLSSGGECGVLPGSNGAHHV